MTLVSVITPCWNGEEFLHVYFQKILSQTHNELELVFINDGSTDSSAAICDAYRRSLAERGFRFVYLEQRNQGAAAAIKNGLEHATGEYLMLCDVDDKLGPSAVDAMSTFLDMNAKFGMVRCNGRYEIEGRGRALFIESKKEREKEQIFESLLLGDTNNWPGSYMVRHSLLRQEMGDEPMFTSQFGQNLQIMLPVAYRYRSGFVDRPLVRYVVRQGSHSHPAGKTADKTVEFSQGYEEIRLGVLQRLKIPEHERDFYQRLVRVRFARHRMFLAENHGRADLFEPEYVQLRALDADTHLDAVRVAVIKTPLRVPVRSLIGLQRRIRSLFRRGLRTIKQRS